jgi:type II secretory pathway pseudopilin PulG
MSTFQSTLPNTVPFQRSGGAGARQVTPVRASTAGFTLFEISIWALIIAAMLSLSLIGYASHIANAEADAQADQLLTLSNAVANYESTYAANLTSGQGVAGVVSARSPTVSELLALGMLPPGFSSTNLYGGGYSISLTLAPAGCTGSACSVSGLTSMTSPLVNGKGEPDDALAGEALSHAGVDAAMSSGTTPTVLAGLNGGWSAANPAGAVPDALAIRSGYGSASYNEFVRRDGSTPMQGTLNLANNNIINAGSYTGTGNITTTGTVQGQYVQINGAATVGAVCASNGLTGQDGTGLLLSCQGGIWKKLYKAAQMHRFVFTSTQTWTVPQGVTNGFITMAGGGGSGAGWRIGNATISGHSGGYVFNAPANLVPGETLTIVVGAGGAAYAPYATTVPVPGTPYYVMAAPGGDDGTGGYAGSPSLVISPTHGTLLECDGGSGSSFGNIDNYTGPELVAGNYPGANTGSGVGPYAAPSRVAAGNFVTANGPGACGPNLYGIGNPGSTSWNMTSGDHTGGVTPLGYGSGGDVWVSQCYVSPTLTGTCTSPVAGRAGVVYIDVQY